MKFARLYKLRLWVWWREWIGASRRVRELVQANQALEQSLALAAQERDAFRERMHDLTRQLEAERKARTDAYDELVESRIRVETTEREMHDLRRELVDVLKHQVDWHAVLSTRRSVYGNEPKVVGVVRPPQDGDRPAQAGILGSRVRRRHNQAVLEAWHAAMAEQTEDNAQPRDTGEPSTAPVAPAAESSVEEDVA
jgi:hypothetical protein